MPSNDYIKELTSPSLLVLTDTVTPPQRFTEYFADLESLRMEYVEYLSSCGESVVKECLRTLEEVIQTIEKRSFVQMREYDLSQMVVSGWDKEAVAFRECKTMDTGLLKSAQKTVAFIKTILNEKDDTVPVTTPQPQQAEQKEKVTVISGTTGLADFLGCGKTKAFEIISSGILKDAGIQYKVGRTWKFNAEKLEKYITEHPEFLK